MKNQDKPAYPQHWEHSDGCEAVHQEGLSKREYFASMAMQGFCSTGNYSNGQDVAHDAVRAADALLAELEETK